MTLKKNPKLSYGLFLWVFLISLSLPALYLGFALNRYFENQALNQVQSEAEAILDFTEDRLLEMVRSEDTRPFTEYRHTEVKGLDRSFFRRVSTLAQLEPQTNIPGVIGYFQINEKGVFTSPVWSREDETAQLSPTELSNRRKRMQQIYNLLKEVPVTKKKQSQKLPLLLRRQIRLPSDFQQFQQLADSPPLERKGRAFKSKKTSNYFSKIKGLKKASPKKKVVKSLQSVRKQIRIESLDATVDPFRALMVGDGHIAFFRKVEVKKRALLQGFLVSEGAFFQKIISPRFRKGLKESQQDQIVLAKGKEILPSFSEADKLKNQQILILESRFPKPLEFLTLYYSSEKLRVSRSRWLANGVLTLFFLVLSAGLFWLYRIHKRQLDLVQRQSDFVSAVSHELRTPLTAIRMHSEMLMCDWVKEEEKKSDSFRFIFEESERLSRLINNVLSFARIGRGQLDLKLEEITVKELSVILENKVSPVVTGVGFEVQIQKPGDSQAVIAVDRDAILQVLLNLCDNAVKFSKESKTKIVELEITVIQDRTRISVRDFGPGVSSENLKKIFSPFYREERELTRQNKGTGIGLALVKELVEKMGGEITVELSRPGLKVHCEFPIASRD